MNDSRNDEFSALMSAMREGTIDSRGIARIEELVLADPTLRQTYLQYVGLTADLTIDADPQFVERILNRVLPSSVRPARPTTSDLPPSPSSTTPVDSGDGYEFEITSRADFPQTKNILLLLLPIVLVATLIAFQRHPSVTTAPVVRDSSSAANLSSDDVPRRATSLVARVTKSQNCVWHDDKQLQQTNDFLRAGSRLELVRGSVELGFFSGARMVAHAPVKFELRSPDSVMLHSGRVRVRADSNAIGFTVVTPDVSVVDMGTEFGVSVDQNGDADVDVFEGQVLAQVVNEQGVAFENVSIPEGTAMQFSAASYTRQTHPLRKFADVQLNDLPDGYERWWQYSAALANDPHMVAYYRFEHPMTEPTVLVNCSTRGSASDGVIENAEWVPGRWPQKSAVRFNGADSRILVDVPDGVDELSIAAWVRLPKNVGAPASLIHSDGHTWDTPGSVHWMINPRHTLHCAFVDAKKRVMNSFSDPMLNSTAGLQWHHVAVVCDMHSGNVSQFIDGRVAGIRRIEHPRALKIGHAQIGNSSLSDRCFSGVIDEFMVLRRTLSPAEIRYMYHIGCPASADSLVMK